MHQIKPLVDLVERCAAVIIGSISILPFMYASRRLPAHRFGPCSAANAVPRQLRR
jgi:hypothetical protein